MSPHPALLSAVAAVACVTGAAAPSTRPAAPPRSPPGPATPEAAVETYFRASDNGSSALLRRAFLPATVMHWVGDDGVVHAKNQLEWWAALDADAAPHPADRRSLEVLDREGPFALIAADSRWPTHRFDDLLLVVATPDGWHVAGKIFARLPPAPVPRGRETPPDPAAEAEIRAVIDEKIAAHAHFDPARLFRSHLADSAYVRVGVDGIALATVSLSEAAWTYAARRDAGEDGHTSRWRVLAVHVRGTIAAAKLDVVVGTTRYIDHLLLLRTAAGWRIAAATWGDPAFVPARPGPP